MTDLLELARAWADGDPDSETRREIEELITRGDLDALTSRFVPVLGFGTAGIRGVVGAGPGRMNRAVVIRTTHGLASYLAGVGSAGRTVLLGYDARPTSRTFAEDTAGVLAAAGFEVLYFDTPTPTPLVAYAARIYEAVAAVVITASHNPPADNGYKVYSSNAAQIIPPTDTAIEKYITGAPPANQVPIIDNAFSSEVTAVVPDDVFERYLAEVETVRPRPVGSNLGIVYTPIHGVGGEVVTRLMTVCGHRNLIRVEEQFEPDGTFPTVSFPNPEEPGALDLAISTARRTDADLIIANDPDADRLAAVVPLAGEWRTLTGNDLGCLLGDFVLRHRKASSTPIVVSSIVSSPMLARIAAVHGARYESTLTGFKWIINAGLALEAVGEGTFVYGYEEALGYTIGQVVRDKDGMSAAVVFADLVASLHDIGQSVWDRLIELWGQVGIWASGQHSVTRGAEVLARAVDQLGASPPKDLAGMPIRTVVDYRHDASTRPVWLGAQELIELSLGEHGRVLVRPSGTEPKLKIYVDLTQEPGDDPLAEQMALAGKARAVGAEMAERLGL